MKLQAIGREYLPSNKIRELMKITYDKYGDSKLLQFPHELGGVIMPDDTEQLYGELLAYAGSPPPDESPGVLPWIQDVLKALSEIYPESGSRARLDTMVRFSDYCKEKRQ